MKDKAKKLKEIKKLLGNFSGRNENCADKAKGRICLEVHNNADITDHIAALLEVCYFALDGNGMFVSPTQKNARAGDSVLKVLEMALNLLPHGQMHCLDCMEETVNGNVKEGQQG